MIISLQKGQHPVLFTIFTRRPFSSDIILSVGSVGSNAIIKGKRCTAMFQVAIHINVRSPTNSYHFTAFRLILRILKCAAHSCMH